VNTVLVFSWVAAVVSAITFALLFLMVTLRNRAKDRRRWHQEVYYLNCLTAAVAPRVIKATQAGVRGSSDYAQLRYEAQDWASFLNEATKLFADCGNDLVLNSARQTVQQAFSLPVLKKL